MIPPYTVPLILGRIGRPPARKHSSGLRIQWSMVRLRQLRIRDLNYCGISLIDFGN